MIGELLEPRRDIDALAVPVRSLDDHFAQIDADAHVDALVLGEALVPFGHAALDVGGAFDRVDDAGELGCAATGGDRRLDQLRAADFEPLEGPRLVQLHEAAVADDVGGEDGGELPFHERALLALTTLV